MTEMSEVSSMSEIQESPSQVTGDAKDGEGKGNPKKRLILGVLALLLLLGIVGVAAAAVSQSEDSEKGSGSSEDDISKIYDDQGDSTLPPQATPTTAVKPPLDGKILICTANPSSNAPVPNVTDGICDFLMYRPTSNPFTSLPNEELQGFNDLASQLVRTRSGIDIRQEIRGDVISQFKDQTNRSIAENAMGLLYGKKVQHYSTFDIDFNADTTSDDVSELIDLLTGIGQSQDNAKGTSPDFGYLFVGVSPVAHNVTDKTATTRMASLFQRLLDEVKPDGVLFLTTYLRTHVNDSKCRTTGPSLWTRAILYDQPTFVDSLNFRDMLEIPPTVIQLLSLSVHGRWSLYNDSMRAKGNEAKEYLRLGSVKRVCNETIITDVVNYTCINSTFYRYPYYRDDDAQDRVDDVRITRVVRPNYTYWEGAYDSWATMQMKMCKACFERTHRGGWVVFDIQYADVHNFCNTGFLQGLGYVRRIKDYMFRPMTECVMNNTVDIVERGIKPEWLSPFRLV